MLNPEQIEKAIVSALPGAAVKVIDTTGTSDHFDAIVVWNGFEGKSLVEQHQLVMNPLKEAFDGPLHALALKTYTPEAWKKKKEMRSENR